MRVPVTDAFDESDHLESRDVELTTKQVEWLEKKADERGVSFDHMLRSVITAQIRVQNEGMESPSSPSKGDGSPSAAAEVSADGVTASDEDAPDDGDESGGPSSIVDSLRSASERLQDLTDEDETTESSDRQNTLERLQARLGNDPDSDEESEDASHGTVLVDEGSRSMFDMMEED